MLTIEPNKTGFIVNRRGNKMDDFGNDYQTEEWHMTNDQYGFSMATFGFFDDVCFLLCFESCTDWAACEV